MPNFANLPGKFAIIAVKSDDIDSKFANSLSDNATIAAKFVICLVKFQDFNRKFAVQPADHQEPFGKCTTPTEGSRGGANRTSVFL